MKLKRLAALLLCAAVMLPLASCVKKPDSGTSRTSQTTDDTTVTPTKDGDTSITATDKGNKGAAAQDLMQGITKGKGASKKPDSRFANVAASFALDLFKDEYKSGKNTLVSPLSVLTALAMTQNGAEGKTLSEMQKAHSNAPIPYGSTASSMSRGRFSRKMRISILLRRIKRTLRAREP